MIKQRTAALGCGALLLAGGALAATGSTASADTPQAETTHARTTTKSQPQEAKVFCQPANGWAVFLNSGERTYKGRFTSIDTDGWTDTQARAYAEDISEGDRVVVQRSNTPTRMVDNPQHPKTSYVNDKLGGYGSCGHTANWAEANIDDYILTPSVRLQTSSGKYSYAVRACVFPEEGGKGCSATRSRSL
ncbi:hypothetical protein ACTWQF_36615 [Streptomyces sp. 8N114]|uniref:hypothetical protein n=1 Tax=Streptomyces sp. 8N114 TaxID=3457419 RepID=UPI003FD25FCF